MSRLIGYARIFTDSTSGVKTSRPELDAALNYLREGDQLVVCRLDRLVFSVYGAIVPIERKLITGRTRAGLAVARAQGWIGGRSRFITDANVEFARDQRTQGISWNNIAASFRIIRTNVQRSLSS